MEKLAYVGKIISLLPIPDADRIESAIVVCGEGGRWTGVVGKGEFNEGDTCIVYLQDAVLQPSPDYAFLEKAGWRIKMARFRGAPSECLILPNTLGERVGANVTDVLRVIKHTKPLPANIGGDVAGNFPGFIPKTDEPNFQAVGYQVTQLVESGVDCYFTEKADGTSGTAYWNNGTFGVCSRNYEMKRGTSVYWAVAEKYKLESVVPKDYGYAYAVQFEVVGPGIQKNPMGLDGVEIRVFDVYNIAEHRYLDYADLLGFCFAHDLPMVRLTGYMPLTEYAASDEHMRKMAEGEYPNGRQREGIVIRPCIEMRDQYGERVSFKVINLLYKE